MSDVQAFKMKLEHVNREENVMTQMQLNMMMEHNRAA